MRDEMNKLHSDLDVFRAKGSLFDVPITALDLNLNKRCRFINPSCEAEKELATIVAVQRDYKNELCYRVVLDSDVHRFGRCASIDEIEILD